MIKFLICSDTWWGEFAWGCASVVDCNCCSVNILGNSPIAVCLIWCIKLRHQHGLPTKGLLIFEAGCSRGQLFTMLIFKICGRLSLKDSYSSEVECLIENFHFQDKETLLWISELEFSWLAWAVLVMRSKGYLRALYFALKVQGVLFIPWASKLHRNISVLQQTNHCASSSCENNSVCVTCCMVAVPYDKGNSVCKDFILRRAERIDLQR